VTLCFCASDQRLEYASFLRLFPIRVL
jgi:hypothetical protein